LTFVSLFRLLSFTLGGWTLKVVGRRLAKPAVSVFSHGTGADFRIRERYDL